MVRNSKREERGRHSGHSENPMGLTEAFHPISSDGFTTAMTPVDGADGGESSVEGETIIAGAGETFAEVDLRDEQGLDNEGLAAGESFPDEEAFENFYAGRPVHAEPPAASLPLISHEGATKPATKAKGEGPRHGRHAPKGDGAAAVPEYMRKSRRMRRILIVVIIVLVVALAAFLYFFNQVRAETEGTAVQQVQSEQQLETIEGDETKDASTETAKTTTVPNLVSLLGVTQDEAVEKLQHGAQVSSTREVNEEGNPIKQESRVALTAEPSDSRTGTPTVYLGLDAEGKIIQAGYSASTSALGYGSLSFSDAVRNEDIIQKTLAEAGLSVPEDAVQLPEDAAEYTTFDSDGKTRTKEYCSFSGTVDADGVERSWSAVLSYDYAMANASGNLADTVRTIFVYVNA